MADRSVAVRLRVEYDQAKRALRDVSESVKGIGTASVQTKRQTAGALGVIAESARQNEQAFSTVGTGMLAMGTAAALGVGVAVKAFTDFDAAMSNVRAATGETAASMEKLREAALQAGADTAFSATEAAAGIENLAKAGVSTADILSGGLQGALDLAAAGQLDVAQASEFAASAMTQFGLKGTDVVHVADVLSAAAGKAQGSVQDVGLALSYAGVPAAGLGVTLEETAGALALFASNGIIGEKAGTALRAMLVSMTNPVGKTKDLMDQLGISFFDARGEFIGLEDVAGVLQDRLGGVTDQQRNAALAQIFGNESLSAAQSLYAGGADAVDEWTRAVSDQGYAAEQAAMRLDNLKGDLEALGGALETALIGAGEGANGPLRAAVQTVTDAVNAFSDLPAPVQQGALALGGIGAAVGLTGGAFLLAVPKVVDFYDSLGQLGPMGRKAQSGMSAMGSALPTAAKWAASAAAVYALAEAADSLIHSLGPAAPTAERATAALLEMQTVGDLEALFGDNREGVDSFVDALGRLQSKNPLQAFGDLAMEVLPGTGRHFRQAKEDFEALDAALAQLATSGHGERAAEIHAHLAAEARRVGVDVEDLNQELPMYQEALAGVENESRLAAGASGEMGGALQGMSEEAAEAADELADLIDQLTILEQTTLDSARAGLALQEAVDAATEAAAEHGATLDATTESGRTVHGAILDLAEAINEKAVADYEATRSAEGVLAANDGLLSSLPELQGEFVETAMQMGFSEEAARSMAAQYLKTPDEVKTDVELIGDTYARTQIQGLDRDINALNNKGVRVDVALGPGATRIVRGMNLPVADGDVFDFAGGGQLRRLPPIGAQQPQIQPNHGPVGIQWAETGSGPWEAFISGHPGKRDRSAGIWRETGKRLGMQWAEFADGGVVDRDLLAEIETAAGVRSMRTASGRLDSMFGTYAATLGGRIADRLEDELEPAAHAGSSSGLIPIMRAAREFVMDEWGITNIGGFARRNIYGTSKLSDHALGKAIDIMTRNLRVGWDIARYFAHGEGRSRFDAENVIWQQSISSDGGPFRRMADRGSPTQNHMDHVHVDTYDDGGFLMPGWNLAFNGLGVPEPVGFADGGFVETVNSLPDGERWRRYGTSRPPAPAGYTWAEDLTLVPTGFYSRPAPRPAARAASSYVSAPFEPYDPSIGLLAQARGAGGVEQVRELLASFDELNEAKEYGLRLSELQADLEAAQADYAQARRENNRYARHVAVAEGQEIRRRIEELKYQRERDAVNDLIASLEELERKREEAAAAEEELAREAERRQQEAFDRYRSRRDALTGNVGGLGDVMQTTWGASADWLTQNIEQQVELITEWQSALGAVRAKGLFDGIIEAMGLDQGPQALGQVQQLAGASRREIRELNAAFAEREAILDTQARRDTNYPLAYGGSGVNPSIEVYVQAPWDHTQWVRAQAQHVVDGNGSRLLQAVRARG